jgi:hypothetical protein
MRRRRGLLSCPVKSAPRRLVSGRALAVRRRGVPLEHALSQSGMWPPVRSRAGGSPVGRLTNRSGRPAAS